MEEDILSEVIALSEKPAPDPAADSKPPAEPAADRPNYGAIAEKRHLNLWCNLPRINQEKYKKLVQELAAENIPDPNHKDVMRITRLSAAQASLYLKAFKASKKAAAE